MVSTWPGVCFFCVHCQLVFWCKAALLEGMLEKRVNSSIHFQYKCSIFPFCWRYRLINTWTNEQVRLGLLICRYLHLMGILNIYRFLCIWPKEQNHDRTEKDGKMLWKPFLPSTCRHGCAWEAFMVIEEWDHCQRVVQQINFALLCGDFVKEAMCNMW